MASEVDSLSIKISAKSQEANAQVDKLISKLSSLSKTLGSVEIKVSSITKSLSSVDTKGLQKFSSGISILGDSMKKMQEIKLPDFTRTSKGIQKFEKINGEKLSGVSACLSELSKGISEIGSTKFDNKAIINLVNTLTRLSNSNVGSLGSVDFGQIGNSIVQLAKTLSNAKSVSSNTVQFVNAVSRLSSAGEKTSATSASLPVLGKNLKILINSLSGAKSVSEKTIQFSAALGNLASAGNKASQTASGLGVLSVELSKFMQVMSKAPSINSSIIQMTEAIGNLANSGKSAGSASRGIMSSFNSFSSGAKKTQKSSFSLASSFGKLYASYWLLFRAMSKVKSAIDISSDLTEVENVVVNTFGQYSDKIEKFSKNAIQQFGISEFTAKETASRFQAMGVALGAPVKKMSDMSIALTKLSADMASFYNVSEKDTARSLQAIFTGETEPLRKYGLDLTQATLKQWALKNGMDADIKSMDQLQKTMLRYQYVMKQTGNVQGDFARTSSTWANQIRMLQEQFKVLGSILGKAFINMLKPFVQALNKALSAVITFADNVVNALGKIFGWKVEIQSGSIDDAASAMDDLSDNTSDAEKNAKKLHQQLQGIDELNVLTTPTKSNKSSGNNAQNSPDASGNDLKYKITETEGAFKSSIDNLKDLGKYISKQLTSAMQSINWSSIYQKANGFGTGLANFLNGLITPDLFSALGQTIAGALNTAITAALSFAKTFDWKNFGTSLAAGVNSFFKKFDFEQLADAINKWVDGIKTTVITFLKKVDWMQVLKSGIKFLAELDLDTVTIALGAIAWKYGGKALVAGALNSLLQKQINVGIGSKTVSLKTTIALSIATAIESFKIGNWLYDNVKGIQSVSDAIAAWIFKDGEKISITRALTVAVTGITFSIAAGKIASSIGQSISTAISTGTLASTVASSIKTALSSAGKFLTTDVAGIFTGGAASIAGGIFSALGAAIGGWNIGQLIYDKFEDQIDSIVEKILDFFTKSVPSKIAEVAGSATAIAFDFAVNVKGTLDENAQKIKEWFSDKAVQTKDFIANAKASIKEGFEKVRSFFSDLGTATKNLVAKAEAKGKDSLDALKSEWSALKAGTKKLAASFKDAASSKINKVKKTWDKIKTLSKELTVTFKDNFTSFLKKAWNKLADSINGMVDKIPVVGQKIANVPKFAGYEKGGYPQKYSLFMAGENGIPEIAGTVGGRTAVAGGAEITGIRDAIYSTSQQEMEYLREQNQLLQGILAKEVGISKNDIGKASRSYARDYYNRTGKEAYSF